MPKAALCRVGILVVLCLSQPLLLPTLLPLGLMYRYLQQYYRQTAREVRRLSNTARCASDGPRLADCLQRISSSTSTCYVLLHILGIVGVGHALSWSAALAKSNLVTTHSAVSTRFCRCLLCCRSPVYTTFSEALDGAATIRAFGAQKQFADLNEQQVAALQQASFAGESPRQPGCIVLAGTLGQSC